MHVERATRADLDAIREAYEHARAIQRARAAEAWPEFTNVSILAEIDSGRLLRVMHDGALVGVFSVAYDDAAIWSERERGEHVYLHRIARAASATVSGIVDAALEWARAHCRELGRVGLRMDTWASNRALIAYYEARGFRVVAHRRIEVDPRLPPHYYHREFTLLEE